MKNYKEEYSSQLEIKKVLEISIFPDKIADSLANLVKNFLSNNKK